MKSILLIFTLLAGAAPQANTSDSGLFVVVTSSDAETQMMAMVLATQSMNQDVSVRILLCSEAGELAIKNSESPTFAPVNRSPKQLLSGLIDHGAVVEVCGIFLPNREYTAADLMDGIGTASPPEVAEHMRGDGIRYFTF